MNNQRQATQGSALMMALMIVGAVGAVTALSVVVARNETISSQSIAQETLQRSATSGDNQLATGALEIALPKAIEKGIESGTALSLLKSTQTGPSNAVSHNLSLPRSQTYALDTYSLLLIQREVDSIFCNMSSVNSFRVYITRNACNQLLPSQYSLPLIETATGDNTVTWNIPVVATWKRDGIPFISTGTVQVVAGNAGAGFWTLNAEKLQVTADSNTTGRIRGEKSLRVLGNFYAKSASTLGCQVDQCSDPVVGIGLNATSFKDYKITALKPSINRPCHGNICPIFPEGLMPNGPKLTPTEDQLDRLSFAPPAPTSVVPDPPMVIDVTASSARIETWYGPWNSMYAGRPVAPNAQNVYSATRPPPNPMVESVDASGRLTVQYQLANDLTMTQFIRVCTGTTGTYSGCKTYYSWEERNQPALVKVSGTATVSGLMEVAPSIPGTPLKNIPYPSLGKNRRMTIQSRGELRINSNLRYPLNVCFGETEITTVGGNVSIKTPTCSEDPAAGISTTQSTLLGLRSLEGNISLTSNALRQQIEVNASLMADRGNTDGLYSGIYRNKLVGNIKAASIGAKTRVETDPRLSSGRLSAPGFPYYSKQVLHMNSKFSPPVRTDQLRNAGTSSTVGGIANQRP